MHFSVAGNIGSGKTTLTKLLSDHYGWDPHFENVDENPYLNDFYKDMNRWSFNLQVSFLTARFNQIISIHDSGNTVIQDRTIYEDAFIFAPNLHSMGLMSSRDFENYFSMFQLVSKFIKPPDLILYLRASVPTLVDQIQKRGREFENEIRIDYLKKLNNRYDNWADSYSLGKMLIIDVDNINFAESKADLSTVIDKIDAHINGLF